MVGGMSVLPVQAGLSLVVPSETDSPAPALALRDYQEAALSAIREAASRGVRRQLLTMPTGCGKTVVFSALIRQRRPRRSLVIAHRDELIQQAHEKLRMAMPGVPIGVVKAERDEWSYPVVVASMQTLARPNRLARLSGFDTIVVDEAHHAQARTYVDALEYFGCATDSGPLLLGVTATPDGAGKRGLSSVFDEVVYQVNMLDMIAQGYLADLRALRIQIEADIDSVRTKRGEFDQAQMEQVLTAAKTPYWTAEAVAGHAADRRVLVFAQSVQLAYDTVDELRDRGIAAAGIDGEMPIDERRDVLTRFAEGRLQAVCNFGVLTEGFDLPAIDCVAIARPTQSRALYVQMVGRGMRTFPGKADCLILDVVGVTERYAGKLQTAATLAGLPSFGAGGADGGREGRTLTEAMREAGGLFEDPITGRMVALPVELFRSRQTVWVPGREGSWHLSTGKGFMALRPAGGQWSVLELDRDGWPVRELAAGLDLGYAQGVAEDAVRELGGWGLVDREAGWRKALASEKQLTTLRRMRIALPEDRTLTRGEASDLITAAMARRI